MAFVPVFAKSRAALGAHPSALAIGSDPGTSHSFRGLLEQAGIAIHEAGGSGAGLRMFYAEHPDVVILDLDAPGGDGFEVLATIRRLSDVPVIALTAGDGEADRVKALRAGADDCLTKPIGDAELVARIEVLLRRPRAGDGNAEVFDDGVVHIDLPRHRVEVLGVEVDLTPTEFRMLATFAENPERVLGHGQLLELVWGDRIREQDEVKLYVSYLRRKLGAAAGVDPVETVRGIGYRYRPRVSGAENGNGNGSQKS